jgi:hypothetical protein
VRSQILKTRQPANVAKKSAGTSTHGEPVRSTAPPIVNSLLNSPGQPLDAETRAFVEPRFGHDFSHVRNIPQWTL